MKRFQPHTFVQNVHFVYLWETDKSKKKIIKKHPCRKGVFFMKTKNARKQKKQEKMLKHLDDIATAFLKARGVHPPDEQGFLESAGEKEVSIFNGTMYLVEKGAKKIDLGFDYWYSAECKEWLHCFIDEAGAVVFVE